MRRPRFSLCALTIRSTRGAALVALIASFAATSQAQQIVYVDAVPDNVNGVPRPTPANTTLLGGAPWGAVTDNAADNLWRFRESAAWGNGGIYETQFAGPEDAPMLVTTVTGLDPSKSYRTYGFFWSNPNENWHLKITTNPADINDNGTPGDFSDDYLPDVPGILFSANGTATSTDAPIALASDFAGPVVLGTNPILYKAELGIVSPNANGELVFYIDDLANQPPGGLTRTWYDGVGYEEAGFPTLTINRDTGEMVYSSDYPRNIAGYSIRSSAGTLTQDGWKSISEFYDATATGPQAGLVDNNDSWVKLSHPTSASDLSEAELNVVGPMDGGVLPAQTPISFGTVWAKYFTEDVTMDLLLNDAAGTVESVKVDFIGNNDSAFPLGDFNFNGSVGPEDFAIFIDSLFAPISGTPVQAYAQGDLTGDIVVDHDDLVAYRSIYNAANGAGSFQALLAGQVSVPEPQSMVLLLMGCLMLMGVTLSRHSARRRCTPLAVTRSARGVALVALVAGFAATSQGQIIYVDAVPADHDGTPQPTPANTTLLGGAPWSATNATAVDNLYRFRTGATWGNQFIYETNANGAEDAPMLVTTVTGLDPNERYLTYGYFWSNPLENWRLKITHDPANINNNGTPSDPLDDFLPDVPGISFSANGSATSTDAPTAVASQFATPKFVGVNPVLYQANLGINTPNANGELVFYVDDLPNQPATIRTWYDGVGYQRVLDMTLQVNTTTGVATLKNVSGANIDLTYYKITSENQMNENGWITLDMQGFDATDGSDAGTVAGDSVLEGWDMAGGSNASLLAEVNFLGASVLPADFSITLGQAFKPGVTGGVTFEFETPYQGVMQGIVEYVTSVPLAGDYDGNGAVEAADYTLWKLQYGQTGSGIASDGNSDGTIDAADYLVWRNALASPGSLTVATASVPEPASVVGLGLLAAVGLVASRARRVRPLTLALLVALGGWLGAPRAMAAPTPDRIYSLGDDELEGSGEGVGVGTSNTGGLAAGNSADSQGPTGAYLDLEKGGTPTYTAVAGVGSGRPLATPGTYGVRFNGTTDYLSGIPLNRPDELALILATATNPSTYPLNYTGITRRGMQMWVYPEQAGINAGGFQSIVSDSIFAGGPAINEQGEWSQMTSRHFANIATGPESTTAVVGNTWHHVMQHISVNGDPNSPVAVTGSGTIAEFNSVVYVNGIAVSANNDTMDFTRTYQTGPPVVVTGNPQPNYDHRLVVGGSELANPDSGGSTLYGNFFNGVVDDLEMYVYGDNTAQGGENWGSFNLFEDNAWIKNQIDTNPLLQGNLKPGDINRDGEIDQADIDAFVSGWLSRKEFQGAHSRLTAGDWETWTWGDMDHDGIVYLKDLSLMHKALVGAGLGGFDVSLLAGGGAQVPEPATLSLLAALATFTLVCRRWRRR